MIGDSSHLYVIDDELCLAADPAGAEPSVIPGVSVAELAEMLENIRWFSRLSLADKLSASRRARFWRQRWRRPERGDGR